MHPNFSKYHFCMYFFHIKNMCSKQQFCISQVGLSLCCKTIKNGFSVMKFLKLVQFKLLDCNWRREADTCTLSSPLWKWAKGSNCWGKRQEENWDSDHFSHLNFATNKCEWRLCEATNESWNIYISFSEDYWSICAQKNKNKQNRIFHFAVMSLMVYTFPLSMCNEASRQLINFTSSQQLLPYYTTQWNQWKCSFTV